MTLFFNNGQPTDEAKKVIAYLESLMDDAGDNPVKLNGLPGFAKDYDINVHRFGMYTPEQWVSQHPSMAEAAYGNVQYLEHQEKQASAATENNTALAEEIKALQNEMAKLREELAQKANKTGRKPAASETESEAETASGETESEA